MAISKIKSLLIQIGPFDGDPVAPMSPSRRSKIQLRYLYEDDARKAAETLDKSRLPFNKRGQLTVRVVTSTRFKVQNRIFQAVMPQIDDHRQVWKNWNVLLVVYSSSDQFTIIKIQGQRAEDVASVKKEMDMILTGEVMDSPVLCDAKSFGSGKFLQNDMENIEQELQVVIQSDARNRLHRIYGPKSRCSEAKERLSALEKSCSFSLFEIQLSDLKFNWAREGGFREVSSLLRDNVVAFDIFRTPKCILINGSQADLEKATEVIEKLENSSSLLRSETSVAVCAACWTEARNPIHTQCSHVYCVSCFENLCQSSVSTESEVLIKCVGDGDHCRRVFPLDELQEHLSSRALEEILDASFSSYVCRNQADYRHCATPDCGQIYRVTAPKHARTYTCLKCCASTCTACHGSHHGIACTENESRMLDESLKNTEEKLVIKEWPPFVENNRWT